MTARVEFTAPARTEADNLIESFMPPLRWLEEFAQRDPRCAARIRSILIEHLVSAGRSLTEALEDA